MQQGATLLHNSPAAAVTPLPTAGLGWSVPSGHAVDARPPSRAMPAVPPGSASSPASSAATVVPASKSQIVLSTAPPQAAGADVVDRGEEWLRSCEFESSQIYHSWRWPHLCSSGLGALGGET
jgi:hypothetical protein